MAEQERDTYLNFLTYMRQKMRDALLGLYGEGLNWRPLPANTNSIYSLAIHSAWAEDWWIGHVVGGRPFEHAWDNDEDYLASGDDPADLLFALDEAAVWTESVLANLESADFDREITLERRSGPVTHTVRWCVVHVIEHYREHIGQMELTRQLWEASRTAAS